MHCLAVIPFNGVIACFGAEVQLDRGGAYLFSCRACVERGSSWPATLPKEIEIISKREMSISQLEGQWKAMPWEASRAAEWYSVTVGIDKHASGSPTRRESGSMEGAKFRESPSNET